MHTDQWSLQVVLGEILCVVTSVMLCAISLWSLKGRPATVTYRGVLVILSAYMLRVLSRRPNICPAATPGKPLPKMALTIQQRVKNIIQQAPDLNTLTERKIREQLAKELSEEEVKQQAFAIKAAVEQSLMELAEAAGGADDDEGEAQEESRGQRKRSREQQADGIAKKPRMQGNEFVLPLSSNTRLAVSMFHGRLQVDLRKTYIDKETGEEKPTGNGLALTPEQWYTLADNLQQLAAGLESGDTDVNVLLSDNRRAYISEFKGNCSVHVREMYTDASGEQQPGKKGVTLDISALELLTQHAADVTAHVQQLGAPGAASGSKPVGSSKPAAAAVVAVAGSSGKQTAAEAAGSTGQTASSIDLGNNKRVTTSNFRGATLVDLREWYQKGNELAPGKKGISLKLNEWRQLATACDAITAAVRARDMSYSLELAPKRRVSLSTFKGTLYVGVREVYEKDGQWLPGAKGLSMNEAQWKALAAGARAFTAGLPHTD